MRYREIPTLEPTTNFGYINDISEHTSKMEKLTITAMFRYCLGLEEDENRLEYEKPNNMYHRVRCIGLDPRFIANFTVGFQSH